MCFSATASFGAGVLLSAVGIVTLKKTSEPSHYFLAFIPLIFGIQQLSEDFVWGSLQNPGHESMNMAATYVFLVFAQVLWPFWVPLSFLFIEKEKRSKNMLRALTVLGFLVSLGFFTCSSFVITALFYENQLISVWCFFAALVSATIYFLVTARYKLVMRVALGDG